MKKRMLSIILALLMLIANLRVYASGGMLGSGTQDDPYIIKTKDDLLSLQDSTLSGKYYKLNNDIDFNGEEMQPIKSFGDAVFDGQKHKISNIKITGTKYSALFSTLSKNAEIKNLVIENATVTVTSPDLSYGNAVLVGKITGSSKITNCGVEGGSISTTSSSGFIAGGLLGYVNSQTEIDGCYSTAKIIGNTSMSTTIGGLIGKTNDKVTVSNSYVISDIENKEDNKAGGFIGYQYTLYQVNVENCYCVTNFSNEAYAFSYFYGSYTKYSFENCYYDGDVCNKIIDNGKTGITKKTSNEMKMLSDTLGESFKSDVTLNDGYPSLSWQKSKGPQNITLNVSPSDAEVSLFDGENSKISHFSYSDGKYIWEKKEGTFTYSVSKEGYETVTGNINAGEEISLTLKPVYNVTFNSNTDITLVLKDESNNIITPKSNLSYLLKNGEYSYEASAEGYKTLNGKVTVENKNVTEELVLEKLYNLKFTVDVSDCDVVLKDNEGNTVNPTESNEFSVTNGEYTYSIVKYGYADVNDTVTVNNQDITKPVYMNKRTEITVNFSFTDILENEELEENPVTVKYGDSVILPTEGSEFSYTFYEGYDYTYSFESGSYTKKNGNIDLSNPNILIELAIRKAWDGESMREPKKDSDGYYLISHGDELYWFANQVNKKDKGNIKAKLTKNIDLGGFTWEPIGISGHIFKGEFDGQGYKISNIYINNSSKYSGLFGYAGAYGLPVSIKNLETEGSVKSGESTGGIIGTLIYGNVENCINRVNVSGTNNVGGIVGCVDGSNAKTIKNCINFGTVYGNNSVGGLFGQIGGYGNVTISDCINIGNITANATKTGGIAGYLNCSYANISDCYTVGNIIKTDNALSDINPAIGKKQNGSVNKIYYKSSLGNDTNGVKSTDDEIKNLAYSHDNEFYFDYDNINQGYPILKFMVPDGLDTRIINSDDFIKTYGVLENSVLVISWYDADNILSGTKTYSIKKDILIKKSDISDSFNNANFRTFLFDSIENLSPIC